MQPNERPPAPWRSFFAVDFLDAVPNISGYLVEVVGRGSSLHRKHHLCLDAVTVATPPEHYEERMVQLYPDLWRYLRLYALEVHDIALAKLERNSERDRYDVQQLANSG